MPTAESAVRGVRRMGKSVTRSQSRRSPKRTEQSCCRSPTRSPQRFSISSDSQNSGRTHSRRSTSTDREAAPDSPPPWMKQLI
eukprot:4243207-Pyramimonas_sp.AAC.1